MLPSDLGQTESVSESTVRAESNCDGLEPSLAQPNVVGLLLSVIVFGLWLAVPIFKLSNLEPLGLS